MLIKSWDGHNFGTDYGVALLAGGSISLPQVDVAKISRLGKWPLLGALGRKGRTLYLGISIENTPLDTYRTQLLQWFDPEDETPKQLVATDDNGSSNPRYVEAICTNLFPKAAGEGVLSTLYIAELEIHGDVKWRKTTLYSAAQWSITGDGDYQSFVNYGEARTYPVFTLTVNSAKSGGFGYKQFVPVRWKASEAATDYPYELSDGGLNTAALVTGSKAQSDGDDFRVQVDGGQVDRWFGSGIYAFNQTTTKIWVNLDFQPAVTMTLETAIAASGSITEIELNEDISGLPSSGILLIGTELFVYTAKDDEDKEVTGITRAAKGSSMAAHSASTSVYWIQHDIWYFYGNASMSAPTQDDDYEPALNLDGSTNTSWDYDDFGYGYSPKTKTARWVPKSIYGTYIDNHYTTDWYYAAWWSEMGIHTTFTWTYAYWTAYNPCGITNANFQNGEKWMDASYFWDTAKIQSSINGTSFADEYTIPAPTLEDTWQSWSRNEALQSGAKYVRLYHAADNPTGIDDTMLEVSDVTLTLNSSYTPDTPTTMPEQGAYELDAMIEQHTDGIFLGLSFVMGIGESLEIDCEEKTITYLEDGTQHMEALTLVGGPRREWMTVPTGSSFQFWYWETGVVSVTIDTDWRERFYG